MINISLFVSLHSMSYGNRGNDKIQQTENRFFDHIIFELITTKENEEISQANFKAMRTLYSLVTTVKTQLTHIKSKLWFIPKIFDSSLKSTKTSKIHSSPISQSKLFSVFKYISRFDMVVDVEHHPIVWHFSRNSLNHRKLCFFSFKIRQMRRY